MNPSPLPEKFEVRVEGRPATQGSIKAFAFQRADGSLGANLTSDNPNLKQWRAQVRDTCCVERLRARRPPPLFTGAVHVELRVILPRLKSHPKTERGKMPLPTKKHDLDKLQRAVGDGLTDGGVLKDDGLVCDWTTKKRYAAIGEKPGAVIVVRALTDADI